MNLVVPSATCGSTLDFGLFAVLLIGAGGSFRVGVNIACTSGTPSYTVLLDVPGQSERTSSLAIKPGDVIKIMMKLGLTSSSFTIKDSTTLKNDTGSGSVGFSATEALYGLFESPALTSALVNFGTVRLSHAEARVPGSILSPIGNFSPLKQSDAKVVLSNLSSTGASFTLKWVAEF